VGEGALLHGVVTAEQAVYAYVRLATSVDAVPSRLRLPGLDPARTYRVRVRPEVGDVPTSGRSQAPWLGMGVELPGAALTRIGLAAPLLHPDQAVLLHAVAVG